MASMTASAIRRLQRRTQYDRRSPTEAPCAIEDSGPAAALAARRRKSLAAGLPPKLVRRKWHKLEHLRLRGRRPRYQAALARLRQRGRPAWAPNIAVHVRWRLNAHHSNVHRQEVRAERYNVWIPEGRALKNEGTDKYQKVCASKAVDWMDSRH